MKTKIKRSEEYLNKYREIISKKHSEKGLVIFTDGSADNSKQTQAIKYGYLIYEGGCLLNSGSYVCNDNFNTSIKSEILAINLALSALIIDEVNEPITIFSDNTWVVEYIVNDKNWVSKSPEKAYYSAYQEYRSLSETFDIKGYWIPRELNAQADLLTR